MWVIIHGMCFPRLAKICQSRGIFNSEQPTFGVLGPLEGQGRFSWPRIIDFWCEKRHNVLLLLLYLLIVLYISHQWENSRVLKPQSVRCGVVRWPGPNSLPSCSCWFVCVFFCAFIMERLFYQNLHRFRMSVNWVWPGICGLSYIKCVSQDEQEHVDPVGFFIMTRPFLINRVR